MKIISILRKINGLDIPSEFTVGQPVSINGQPAGPPVSCIKHFAFRYNGGKVYEGPCYVVEFEDSTVKRVIPVDDNVVEIVVETAKEEAKLPDLPEEKVAE
jgi:hypothetical protein